MRVREGDNECKTNEAVRKRESGDIICVQVSRMRNKNGGNPNPCDG